VNGRKPLTGTVRTLSAGLRDLSGSTRRSIAVSKGRYYVEHTSQWSGSLPHAKLVSDEEAAAWLVANDHELPGDLGDLES
jgi:hypothetical protein